MKKLPLIIALAMLTGSLWSCGSKSSSSEETSGTSAASTAAASASTEAEGTSGEASSEKSTGTDTTEAETTEETSAGAEPSSEKEIKSVKYKSDDKLFWYDVPETLKEYDSDSIVDGDVTFSDGNSAIVGVSTYGGLHYTAKGFADGLVPDFSEEFSDVTCEETEVNGQPAAKITAYKDKDGERFIYITYFVQYGNGELFSLAYAYPASSSTTVIQDVQFIFDSVEFRGKELKTKTETYMGNGFNMDVDEKFFIKDKDDYNVTIKYNLVSSLDEYTAAMRISAEKVDDVKAKADDIYNKWKSHSPTESIGRDTVQFLGHEADHIYRAITISGISLTTEYYIFTDDGDTIAATLTIPNSLADRFRSDLQPALDSVKIK